MNGDGNNLSIWLSEDVMTSFYAYEAVPCLSEEFDELLASEAW